MRMPPRWQKIVAPIAARCGERPCGSSGTLAQRDRNVPCGEARGSFAYHAAALGGYFAVAASIPETTEGLSTTPPPSEVTSPVKLDSSLLREA